MTASGARRVDGDRTGVAKAGQAEAVHGVGWFASLVLALTPFAIFALLAVLDSFLR